VPVKYIGSKRKLIPVILQTIGGLGRDCTVLDLFSGTARVGHALKRDGYRVISNDYLASGKVIAECYVQADAEDWLHQARALVDEFNAIKGEPGYFTDTFCVQSRYFQPKNGERIDAIREEIERKGLEPELKAIMLVSLMEAADRIDSTTGVQMAYLKKWATRAHNDLELRVPDILPRARGGKGEAHQMDALSAVGELEADIAYLDPPYNQHSYLGNYHVWETLVMWDKPEFYGIACKRIDCRTRKSAFNVKRKFCEAWSRVVHAVKAKHVVISFNNEGYIAREAMERLLSRRGEVFVIENDYKRYVGAQIGIHNLQGERVGEVSHLRNKEYIYVVSPERAIGETEPELKGAPVPDASRELGPGPGSVRVSGRLPTGLPVMGKQLDLFS
jgi:adenine-specific DNA-methyltransferase